jgi:hypothetical protein
MMKATEQFLGTVDVRKLRELDWPIVRAVTPSFVDRLELQRYKRRLLASQKWDRIRDVPRRREDGTLSAHTFELYGVPAPDADAPGRLN